MSDLHAIPEALDRLKDSLRDVLSTPSQVSEQDLKNALQHVSELSKAIQRIEKGLRETPEAKELERKTKSEEKKRKADAMEAEYQTVLDTVKGLVGNEKFVDDNITGTTAYHMLPPGCMDKGPYFGQLLDLTRRLTQLKQAPENAPQIMHHKSQMLQFLTRYRPIDSKAFHAQLHPLLDRLCELREGLAKLEFESRGSRWE